MADAKKGALGDFFKKKKKVAVKSLNLNEESTTASKPLEKTVSVTGNEGGDSTTNKKANKDGWKDETSNRFEDVSPSKARMVANLADVQAAEENNKKSKTWSDKPVGGAAAARGGAYQVPSHQPGQVTQSKFPELHKAVGYGGLQVKAEPAPLVAKQGNAFAGLNVDDDSDEEQERLMKPALVTKVKGQKQYTAPTNLFGATLNRKDADDDPVAEREANEKMKRKLEKEAEKAKAKAEREAAKAEELKEQAATKAASAAAEVFDASKFSYGQFNVTACEAKYAEREKLVAAC
ncbi:unnamed protein product [Amoebophrya sp. A25]|nr:unnamed protein product [Amoebophrya sp. A25]|eukprot:GSA25T00000580001.1